MNNNNQMTSNLEHPIFSELVANATGPLPYTLMNDYLFRALLQKNKRVLKGLVCSLLHLQPDDIVSVEITNPIVLGEAISDKEFVLGIHVLLNNNTYINLEMQVLNNGNWPERSLGYLCRTFDNLNRGDDYLDTKPAIHIGFLDFHLFPEHPEFYATYKLMNVKNNTIYSDKFMLAVVDLNYIELATEEDKEFQIDYWASLFKATTWEEIKMLAENNAYIQEASETIYQLTADETIRGQCEARNAYYARERHHAQIQKKYEDLIAEKEAWTAEKEELIAEKEAWTTEKETLTAEKEALTTEKEALTRELEFFRSKFAKEQN